LGESARSATADVEAIFGEASHDVRRDLVVGLHAGRDGIDLVPSRARKANEVLGCYHALGRAVEAHEQHVHGLGHWASRRDDWR
jgi:hypothetical protein